MCMAKQVVSNLNKTNIFQTFIEHITIHLSIKLPENGVFANLGIANTPLILASNLQIPRIIPVYFVTILN